MFEYAKTLPISSQLAEITSAVWDERVVILQASPGAGKTTCLPIALLDTTPHAVDASMITVIQPRRVAAKLAAYRCAELMGTHVGRRVGYEVRDDRRCGEETELIFTTAGSFLQRLHHRPNACRGVVILDEFHERSLEMDLIVAWLKNRGASSDLRFVVMSATLDTEELSSYLGINRSFVVPGRMYPVTTEWVPQRSGEDLTRCLMRVCRSVLSSDETGSGLVFLPGKSEIDAASRALGDLCERSGWSLEILHGQLPLEKQRRVVSDDSGKRIILSTNLAETSVTLRDVTWVIDSGQVRRLEWDLETGFESLVLGQISRASADQRAGRAGRVRPGRCYRLFSTVEWNQMSPFEPEAIRREDILDIIAQSLRLEVPTSDWLTQPHEKSVKLAHEWLTEHSLTDGDMRLSDIGRRLASQPMSLREAMFVSLAEEEGLGADARTWTALLQEAPPHTLELSETSAESDLQAWLSAESEDVPSSQRRLWSAWRGRLKRRIQALGGRLGLEQDETRLRYAMAKASPDRVGYLSVSKRGERSVQLCSGRRMLVDERVSVRRDGWVIVVQAHQRITSRGLQGTVSLLAELDEDWLIDLPGERLHEVVESHWDNKLDKIRTLEVIRYGECTVSQRVLPPVLNAQSRAQVIRMLERRGLHEFFGDGAESELQARLSNVLSKSPESFPELGDVDLDNFTSHCIESIAERLTAVSEFAGTDLLDWLVADNAWELRQRLDHEVPRHYQLPGGKRLKVSYQPGRPPYVSSYLQEFFGLNETPMLGGQPLTIELWAPNGRPIQVTSDLTGFWERHYGELAKSLRRRYPKHYWPDDPSSAQAERFKRKVTQ